MAGNKAKHWVFTVFNYDDATFSKFEDIKEFTTYWIYGKEVCPTTLSKHLQCYLVGKKQITLPTMRKWFPDARFAPMAKDATPQHNQAYCSKDKDFKEWGDLPPPRSKAGGEANKNKWKEIVDLATNGKMLMIKETHPKEFITSYRTLKQIGFDHAPDPEDLEAVCGEWIMGESGVGKSHTARTENPDAYIKSMNKWWDNYNGQDTVILEDFDEGYVQAMQYFLKIWADKWKFPVEYKNYTKMIRPKKFVITSQFSPEQLFQGKYLDAIQRRFKVRNIIRILRHDDLISKKRKSTINNKPVEPKKLKKHDEISMKKPKLWRMDASGEITKKPNPVQQLSLNESINKIQNETIVITDSEEEEIAKFHSDLSLFHNIEKDEKEKKECTEEVIVSDSESDGWPSSQSDEFDESEDYSLLGSDDSDSNSYSDDSY